MVHKVLGTDLRVLDRVHKELVLVHKALAQEHNQHKI